MVEDDGFSLQVLLEDLTKDTGRFIDDKGQGKGLAGCYKIQGILFFISGEGDEGHGITSKGRDGQVVAEAADVFVKYAEVQRSV